VRVAELRNGASFAVEAFAELRVGRKLIWQQLDGDVAIEPGVTRAIDLAHTARAGDAPYRSAQNEYFSPS
jgi:hypothetical protein